MNALINATDAQTLLNNPNSIVLDASYSVPDPQGSFQRAHIPGAQFFDIDAVADINAPYAHTLPSADVFAADVSAMGINNDTNVIIYDQNGIAFAAARAWWMFRVFGHDNVHVINGGLPAWHMAGLPLENGPAAEHAPEKFVAVFQADLYRSFEEIETISETGAEQIVDARGRERFDAKAHTIDGDVVTTNIPGSANLPFNQLLDPMGRMLPDDQLGLILKNYQLAADKKLVVSCGSGVTACVLALGFFQTGLKNTAVFDGSWTEWSDRQQIR